MNFTISKNDLLDGINIVSKAISSKIDNPDLTGIYLKAKSNMLTLKGTDVELFIETSMPCTVFEEGEIIVNERILQELVRKLPNDNIIFNIDNNSKDPLLSINCKKSHFEIVYSTTENYPVIPEIIPSCEINIPQKYIKEMVKGTAFAVSNDNARPILQGILFEVKSKKLNLVALDGYRMAIQSKQLDIENDLEFNVVLNGRACMEIVKLLNDKDNISIKLTRNHIMFSTDTTKIVSRLMDGNFINYSSLLPHDNSINLTVDKEKLESAIERAALVGKSDDKPLIKIEAKGDKVIISSNSKVGKSVEEIDGEIKGGDITIAFNSKYILDILKCLDEKLVTLNFNSPVTPCVLNNENYQYLILPVRLAS